MLASMVEREQQKARRCLMSQSHMSQRHIFPFLRWQGWKTCLFWRKHAFYWHKQGFCWCEHGFYEHRHDFYKRKLSFYKRKLSFYKRKNGIYNRKHGFYGRKQTWVRRIQNHANCVSENRRDGSFWFPFLFATFWKLQLKPDYARINAWLCSDWCLVTR